MAKKEYMKILFFIESLHSGGKERRLVELIKGFNQYPEIECELILTKKDIHYKEIFDTGIKIHYIIRKHIKKDPILFFKFYRIAREFKPDIIHAWGNLVAIYAIPAKVLLKIPMINNQITDAPDRVNNGVLSHKLTFPFSDLIIANSKAGLKAYNAPESKSTVIYNGFNFERIRNLSKPNEIKKKFNINTKYVVGMVASFSIYKDYETYIKAAHEVLINNNVTILCIGAGNDSYFRSLVKTEYIENIKFLGRRENIESIMNICDIGVLSTYTEGISNSIMEFMALGKPVIASDGGGTGELIKDNETGFLIKPKSVEELVSKIKYLLDDDKLASKMGEKGKERIRQEFSIWKMINLFAALYRTLPNRKMNQELL